MQRAAQHPTLIGLLTAMAIQRLASEGGGRIASRIDVPPRPWAPEMWLHCMRRALDVERTLVAEPVYALAVEGEVLDAELALVPATVYRQLIAEAELDAIDAWFEDAVAWIDACTAGTPSTAPILPPPQVGLVAPVWLNGLDRSMAMAVDAGALDICRDVARLAWRHRRETGAWPADIATLALDATDPWDPARGSLRLAVDGDDLLVYSIGRDGLDSGGSRVADPGLRLVTEREPIPASTVAPGVDHERHR